MNECLTDFCSEFSLFNYSYSATFSFETGEKYAGALTEGTVSSKQYSTEKKVYFKQRLVESMIKGFLEYTALIITSEEIKSIICRFQRASKE